MAKKSLTEKQDAFARHVVEGKTYSAAYREAYAAENMTKKQVWEEASKLMSHPKVSQRVMELQEQAAERTLVTIQTITNELDDARDLAKEEGQASAMTGAIVSKARLHGLYAKDNEQKTPVTVISPVDRLQDLLNGISDRESEKPG